VIPDFKMTKEEKLQKKLDELKKLSNIIVLHKGQQLTPEKRQELDNWQYKMEFRLSELLDKFKNEEADIKIAVMEKIVKLLNEPI
jgi:hypothetical protein